MPQMRKGDPGVNKRMAKELARSNAFTVGELREMVAKTLAGAAGKMSKVNRDISLERVCQIYVRALDGHDDTEVLPAMVVDPYSRSGRMKPSRHVSLVANILKDCFE